RSDGLLRWRLVYVGEAHPLHGVEVIEIAPELMEAVRRRQCIGMITQMVLAELAGVVTEIAQEPGERRSAGPQIGWATGQLRQDHAGTLATSKPKLATVPYGFAILLALQGKYPCG